MKQISKPNLKSASPMTAMEMNQVKVGKTRTVLTPAVLESHAEQKTGRVS